MERSQRSLLGEDTIFIPCLLGWSCSIYCPPISHCWCFNFPNFYIAKGPTTSAKELSSNYKIGSRELVFSRGEIFFLQLFFLVGRVGERRSYPAKPLHCLLENLQERILTGEADFLLDLSIQQQQNKENMSTSFPGLVHDSEVYFIFLYLLVILCFLLPLRPPSLILVAMNIGFSTKKKKKKVTEEEKEGNSLWHLSSGMAILQYNSCYNEK